MLAQLDRSETWAQAEQYVNPAEVLIYRINNVFWFLHL